MQTVISSVVQTSSSEGTFSNKSHASSVRFRTMENAIFVHRHKFIFVLFVYIVSWCEIKTLLTLYYYALNKVP